MTSTKRETAEFGDFQTPAALAAKVCGVVARRKERFSSIVEPTCGKGGFLVAALSTFSSATDALGLEINDGYVAEAKQAVKRCHYGVTARIIAADFFKTDWAGLIAPMPEPLLVIGNLPWVTNAQLGLLGSANLPEKSNFQGHAGFDAITGKSNFCISEWMLIKLIEALDGRHATLAMLCKTAVARKVLFHAWKNGTRLRKAELRAIDAMAFFGASVDACLLVCELSALAHTNECRVYSDMDKAKPVGVFGYRDGRLVSDVTAYARWGHLRGQSPLRWRSGVKHDCSKVMELWKEGDAFRNGLDEVVSLESTFLYPMLKSSQLANGATEAPRRWMIVTQKSIGEGTAAIAERAPKTWRYLLSHADKLDARSSSIYRSRPRFSIFGVGDYSFAPWKVAISGFYKRLGFAKLGQFRGKPIMLDDTSNFLPCRCEEEADYLCSLLNSDVAREFLSALVFWDAKRPITVAILSELNLAALAGELGSYETMAALYPPGLDPVTKTTVKQRALFR
ncbi:MAG: hypothetical protein ABSF26_08755 [Thermoguttaceae bacterium]|jgi:hypothetical protein